MRASSSASKSRLRAAATLSSICCALLAPTSADVTRPPRRTQARASWARVWLRDLAISSSARSLPSSSSVIASAFRNGLPLAARESFGMPSR